MFCHSCSIPAAKFEVVVGCLEACWFASLDLGRGGFKITRLLLILDKGSLSESREPQVAEGPPTS